MSEVTLVEQQPSLAGKNIWIVDDRILEVLVQPEVASFKNDELLTGLHPVDRGTLIALLNLAKWDDDDPVKQLCRKLVDETNGVFAFSRPENVLDYLERGISKPDIIIYDLVYGTSQSLGNSISVLNTILQRCVSIVQVYAQDPEQIRIELQELKNKYPQRLQDPKSKADVKVDELASLISIKLSRSLSARLATEVRVQTVKAVENVLVNIDNLPLNVAIKLLGGETESTASEMELIELISVKMAEAVRSADALKNTLNRYGIEKGIPLDRVDQFVSEVVELLSAHLRNHIQYSGGLYDVIQETWKIATREGEHNQVNAENQNMEATNLIIRNFFSFRLYDQPRDSIVRTGDIVLFERSETIEGGDLPELRLIITPACDLAHFWKKTRGVLTFVRLSPISQTKSKIKSYTNKYMDNGSVTSNEPMIFPSMPIDSNRVDYTLFSYELENIEIDGNPLWIDGGNVSKKNTFDTQLTYNALTSLGLHVTRKCRISEPFLTGVLSDLRNRLFRIGVPDFPKEEKERLKQLFRLDNE